MSTEEIKNEEPAIRGISGRNSDGTFMKGVSGNILGRPKNTLKDHIKQKLIEMSPEDKDKFLEKINPEMQWRMAEGNPAQSTDITSLGEKIIVIPAQLKKKNDARNNITSGTSEDSGGSPQV